MRECQVGIGNFKWVSGNVVGKWALSIPTV